MTSAAHQLSGSFLITGGAGFIGANIANRIAALGGEVRILDSLSRPGVSRNIDRLNALHGDKIELIRGDVRDADIVRRSIKGCCGVFHMAAQVAVTTSLEQPLDDFAVNVGGTLNVLEAARSEPGAPPVIFASTNKVYGDLADLRLVCGESGYVPADQSIRENGVSERRSLDFHTPYGCSKGAADQYILDYARSFGLRTSVLRMSCIYGPWQMGTEDQGWVAHFVLRALRGAPITIYGDGQQVRDILFIDDAVAAYLAAFRNIDQVSGRAFNLGGGPENAVSLRQVLGAIEERLGRHVAVDWADWRPGDQRYYVSDTTEIRSRLGLESPVHWKRGLAQLVDWLAKEHEAAPDLPRMEVAS